MDVFYRRAARKIFLQGPAVREATEEITKRHFDPAVSSDSRRLLFESVEKARQAEIVLDNLTQKYRTQS